MKKTTKKTIKKFITLQEEIWASEFGDEYTDRNVGEHWIASNTNLFSKIISRTRNVKSVIEFGANRGLNLHAIRMLLPNADISAIEINKKACEILKKSQPNLTAVLNKSIIEPLSEVLTTEKMKKDYDFALIKGVLIHINPEKLPEVYQNLYDLSAKYICICEYYERNPVAISYRGNEDLLFKRDFAGEIMDKFPDLKLVDYGFAWHRDNNFFQNDITWFLLEK